MVYCWLFDLALTFAVSQQIASKYDFGVQSIIANNRMHLNRKQVVQLLPILQKFVDTGEI
jgi:hypothetical protein